jgi:hypothetical protein
MIDQKKLESMFDAIAQLKGWHNPDAYAYQIKNPLMVKSFTQLGRHEIDDEGNRIFKTQLAGIKAGLFDLEMKVSGRSRAGLKDGDKISNLLRVYGISELLGQQNVLKYYRRAIKDSSVTLDAPLTHFLASKE